MTKKLLLADDSITIQKVISIIFATEDYQLLVCDNGDEAYEKAMAEYPDLVIADISMPGKDGFELCQAIKTEDRLGHTSVLLLPGAFEHFDESQAEAVGADGWLSKPFESQALLDKVSQLLEADPLRLSASASVAPETVAEEVATVEGFAGADVINLAAAAETVDGSPMELSADTIDESALGLGAVDALDVETNDEVDDDSADDIWDAVSFEEDDLQQSEELSTVEETPFADVSIAAESTDDVALELEAADDESGFVFSDQEEDPVELVNEVVAEPEVEEPLELVDEVAAELEVEEPLELVDEVVAEPEVEEPLELVDEVVAEPEVEEPLELVDEVVAEPEVEEPLELVDEVAAEPEVEEPLELVDEVAAVQDVVEELPVVEPLGEDSLTADEEVLDLAEDDIFEEITPEVESFEPESIVELADDQPAEVAAEATDEDVLDEDVLESEDGAGFAVEPLVEDEPELVVEQFGEQAAGLEPDPELTAAAGSAYESEGVPAFEEEPEEDLAAEFAEEVVFEDEPAEDEGFYSSAAEPEEAGPDIEPVAVAALAAGAAGIAAVAATSEESPLEQAEQQLRELSEDELREVVAKVAGPTIEKLANEMLEQIVWEVVPDLAESMIKEEIRKIREGAK